MDRARRRGGRRSLSRLRPGTLRHRRPAGPRRRAADPLTQAQAPLPRAIGRLALTGLVLNSVIGSSVFGLPSVIGRQLGPASPWAWAAAALGMALIVASFAEVASRFTRAGGTYLYARVAFGRFAGIEMAWLTYLVRLTAAATNANLFVISVAEFWPAATGPVAAPLLLALVLVPLATANYRGVRGGVSTSSVFAVAKLIPLLFFVAAGVFALATGRIGGPVPPVQADAGTWLEAILLLVFAYGGFEAALLPLGEARDPRRDAPIALFAALGLCALLYGLVQVVVIAALADPGASPRPLAAAAAVFLGPVGAALMAAGALVSVYGYLTAAMLNVPRLIYAMAAEGDLPEKLGAVHPRFRTPYVSVLVFGTTVWIFAAAGSFFQNLTLSAVSRLLTYGAVCVAVVVLRRKERARAAGVEPAWFRVPGGHLIAALGLAFSAVLALRMNQRELTVLAGTLTAGLVHWIWMRFRLTSA